MLLTSTRLLVLGGQAEKPMLADQHLFEGSHGIPHKVEPVGHLQCLWCSLPHAIHIGTGAVTTDHVDPRMGE